MKKFNNKNIFLFILLITINLKATEYITREELQEILKNYVKKEVLLKSKIDIKKEEKEKIEFYKNKLEGANISNIYKKIVFLNKIHDNIGSLRRCDYIYEYKKINYYKNNKLKNNLLDICSLVYKNNHKYEKAINKKLQLLEIEDKDKLNEDIIKELIELYKITGNKEKEIEYTNILY